MKSTDVFPRNIEHYVGQRYIIGMTYYNAI